MSDVKIAEVALLPCPFCGYTARIVMARPTDPAMVTCNGPDCTLHNAFYDEAHAIAAWNRRTAGESAEAKCAERGCDRWIARALGSLCSMQWRLDWDEPEADAEGSSNRKCDVCDAYMDDGHEADCTLAALIAAAPTADLESISPLCVQCRRPFHVHTTRMLVDDDGAAYEGVPACPTRGDLWTPPLAAGPSVAVTTPTCDGPQCICADRQEPTPDCHLHGVAASEPTTPEPTDHGIAECAVEVVEQHGYVIHDSDRAAIVRGIKNHVIEHLGEASSEAQQTIERQRIQLAGYASERMTRDYQCNARHPDKPHVRCTLVTPHPGAVHANGTVEWGAPHPIEPMEPSK